MKIRRNEHCRPTQAQRGRRFSVAVGLVALVAVVATGCSSNPGPPGASETPKLVVGIRDLSTYAAPLYWAAAKGYFKNAGLDLSLQVSGAAHTAQLVAGQTDLLYSAQGAMFGVTDSGKPVRTIYGTDAGAFGYVVTPAASSVKSPADCSTVTTATPGTVVYAWTRQLERIYNAKWNLTQLTTVPAISANIVAGRTDCAIGNINWYQSAIESGRLRVVLDPGKKADLPSGWPALGVEDTIGGLPDVLASKKPAVEIFLKAYHAAIKDYLETDPSEIAKTLSSFDSGWATVGTTEVLAKTIAEFKPFVSPNSGYISTDTWTNTVEFFQKGGLDFLAKDRDRFDYTNAVDMSFYDDAIGKP